MLNTGSIKEQPLKPLTSNVTDYGEDNGKIKMLESDIHSTGKGDPVCTYNFILCSQTVRNRVHAYRFLFCGSLYIIIRKKQLYSRVESASEGEYIEFCYFDIIPQPFMVLHASNVGPNF
ncbi:hypothetical protein ABEB36_011377 [Hypothenemus hampei]|uniref:Uncharacterized protein n=1 Tax=Hypothenemus hampei TaxID=57062 RepID=A0ABD1EFG4_HYPHA